MLIVIMETPLPMATPVPTRPVRARMDKETYTDCVLGILRFLSSSSRARVRVVSRSSPRATARETPNKIVPAPSRASPFYRDARVGPPIRTRDDVKTVDIVPRENEMDRAT